MFHRFWPVLLTFGIAVPACSESSPSSPTSPDGASSLAGVTVSALDGQPIAGVTVRVGSKAAVSDASGAFQIENPGDGNLSATLTGKSIVERHSVIAMPSGQPSRQTLIPATFDLVAFDQMFRGDDHRLKRWTSAPPLVVLTTVLSYARGFGTQEQYYATSEQLTEAETALLIQQLTDALALLTDNAFRGFASVERESAADGAKVSPLREGKIVVGRYNGIEGLLHTVGFGQWLAQSSGQVIGGAVYLDRNFDKNSEARRLLRTHELGHALGYSHVTTGTSIMNPSIGAEPTTFDRQGAIIAFQRLPGNQAPDIDPGASSSSVGPLRAETVGAPSAWSGPIICAPRR